MRVLLPIILSAFVGLVGCKRTQPTGYFGDNQTAMGGVGKAGNSATESKQRPTVEPALSLLPRRFNNSQPATDSGIRSVTGIERAAFVPANAIGYGSFDAQKMLAAAKPIVVLWAQRLAANHRNKANTNRSKINYHQVQSLAKTQFGLDLERLGRVTLVVVVPPPHSKCKAGFFGDPVFLASAEAYSPGKAKLVEKIGSIPLYAPTGRKECARIAVVGTTMVFGSAAAVRLVLAARLGNAPRLVASSSLAKLIKTMRMVRPKASGFLVLDIAALGRELPGKLEGWGKELYSGAMFLTDKGLLVLVRGREDRLGSAC